MTTTLMTPHRAAAARGPRLADAVLVALAAWLPAHPLHGQPWSWQQRHCGHFAGAWLQHCTGRDWLAGLPCVDSARAAARAVQQLAGPQAHLRDAVSTVLGQPPVPAARAAVGDLLLYTGAAGSRLGLLAVCAGTTAYALDDAGMLAVLPAARADCAWPLLPLLVELPA